MNEPKIVLCKEAIGQFCKKHYIVALALFGSVLTTYFQPSSDVDFLVKFDKKNIPTLFDLVTMESELSHIIGYKADLRTSNDLSPYFRDEVVSHAKIIYG